jgi:hypothetical protein
MKNLRSETLGILQRIEALSGRPVEFKPDGALTLRATLQLARNDAPLHVLRYRPTNEPLDYWVAYQASWTPAAGLWSTARLPLSDFRASFRGRPIPDAPPLDSARIRQLGLMVAARQAGPFSLDLRAICLASRAALTSATPRWR